MKTKTKRGRKVYSGFERLVILTGVLPMYLDARGGTQQDPWIDLDSDVQSKRREGFMQGEQWTDIKKENNMNNLVTEVLELCNNKELDLTHFSAVDNGTETVFTIEMIKDNRTKSCGMVED